MGDDGKKTLTPKLRFPEFRQIAGWDPKQLGELLTFGNGRDHKHLADGEVPVYGSGGYMRSVADYLYEGESVCIGRKGTIDSPIFLSGRFWTVDTLFYTHGFKECLPKFVYYLFHLIPWLDYSEAGGVPSLAKTTISKITVFVPSLREQQKIADCLTSLDELIAAQGRKVEALKAHKKGLMQQLFPREGETLPRLRFPEFRDDDRVGFKQIGDFAEVTTGDKDTQNKVDGGKYPFFVRSQNVERIDSYSYDGEAVLTSGDGVGVGENYHYIKGKFDFHQRVYAIYDFDADASGLFFYYYFSTHFKKRVKAMSAKNSVDSVRMPMIKEMPIWLPAIAEQQRIADCLSVLDARLKEESQKLEALKVHKRGLMQQLFPLAKEN
jgi:type I restriction enzyme S subunit